MLIKIAYCMLPCDAFSPKLVHQFFLTLHVSQACPRAGMVYVIHGRVVTRKGGVKIPPPKFQKKFSRGG